MALIVMSGVCIAQDSTRADPVCSVRGHVLVPIDVQPVVRSINHIDLPDSTLLITRSDNVITYQCLRCGAKTRRTVPLSPDTSVVWRKKDEKKNP